MKARQLILMVLFTLGSLLSPATSVAQSCGSGCTYYGYTCTIKVTCSPCYNVTYVYLCNKHDLLFCVQGKCCTCA
jgi:hypothetical protein